MVRRKKRPLSMVLLPYARAVLLVGGIGALVLALAGAAAFLLIDPNGYKPEIEQAVRRATGRELRLRGPLHLAVGLPPTLVAEGVALANMDGGSRPDMLTLERLELTVAPLSWLSREIEVVDLTLRRPDLLLETDAQGRGNWAFAPARLDAAAAPAGGEAEGGAAPAPAEPGGPRFAVKAVHVRDMRVTWRAGPGAGGGTLAWAIPRLDLGAEEAGRSMLLSGRLLSGDRSLSVSGELGPLGRLLDRGSTLPWPMQIRIEGAGAKLALRATLRDPAQDGGASGILDAAFGDLALFAGLLPQPAPTAQELTLSARAVAGRDGAPRLAALTLHAQGVEAPSLAPGIEIARADINAPGVDQPSSLDVQAVASGTPLHLTARIATLAALLPGYRPHDPVPVELALDAADALVTMKGGVRDPTALAGLNLAVLARASSLERLSPLLRRPLPALKQLTLDGTLEGHLAAGGSLTLRNAHVGLPQADISGDLTLALGATPKLSGAVNAQQVDLDGLLAGLVAAADPARPSAAEGAQSAAPPPPPAWLIPDTPFELGWLGRLDADVQVGIAALQTNGVGYSNIAGHVVVRDGALAVDPFAGDTPGGRLDARLSIDSRPPAPPIALTLRAPAMTLQPLAAALGDPDAIAGNAAIDADLRGAGRTPHEVAGSLDGHFGLALANGDVDNALLNRALGDVLKSAKLPETLVGGAGRTKLRCLATRIDVAHGAASVATLALDTSRLLVDGGGGFDLGRETLALRLRPQLRAGAGLALPAVVGGTFLNPRASLDANAALKIGLAPAERAGDLCGPALAIARGGAAPAPANAAPAPPAAQPAKPPKPIDALRRLLR